MRAREPDALDAVDRVAGAEELLGAGTSEWAVRSLSASFSTLTVAALITLTARLAGRRAAMIAGALGCFSPLLVYYGQETRMYALLAFLATLGGYAFVRAATGAARWRIAASPCSCPGPPGWRIVSATTSAPVRSAIDSTFATPNVYCMTQ